MRSFIDSVVMGLANLRANKMRTFLTMLGIIIGISSVIAIMTVGSSLSGSITDSLSSFGITNITVSLSNKDSSSNNSRMFMRSSYAEADLISMDMIDEYEQAYQDYYDYVVLTETVGNCTVTNSDDSATVSIMGVEEEYAQYDEIEMITGRFINANDDKERYRFCVVSDRFLEDLGLSIYSAVGSSIKMTINNSLQEMVIVGIYKYESETSETSSSVTTTMYIPLATAKRFNSSYDGFSSFTVVSKTDINTTWFLETTEDFFASFYTQNDSYTVEASNMESMLETMTDMLSTVTLAISCIATISLLVGGIGVMNIMLVSITERTREIGTRKALGATRNAIRIQFIIEAVIVCLFGGIIGILVGLGMGYVAADILGYKASPDVSSIVYSVLFSIGIGIFFGYYPANKAAKLNPIDALRYE